jgi:hypothetical protein
MLHITIYLLDDIIGRNKMRIDNTDSEATLIQQSARKKSPAGWIALSHPQHYSQSFELKKAA